MKLQIAMGHFDVRAGKYIFDFSRKVDAEEVDVAPHLTQKFAIHQWGPDGFWRVSDQQTGMLVCELADKQACIELAIERLKSITQEQSDMAIKKALAIISKNQGEP